MFGRVWGKSLVYASKMALLFENNEKVFSTTLVVVWEFAAKSEMARRFVTLGPPRGCPTVRGGRRGGGSPPKGTTTLMRLLNPRLPS